MEHKLNIISLDKSSVSQKVSMEVHTPDREGTRIALIG